MVSDHLATIVGITLILLFGCHTTNPEEYPQDSQTSTKNSYTLTMQNGQTVLTSHSISSRLLAKNLLIARRHCSDGTCINDISSKKHWSLAVPEQTTNSFQYAHCQYSTDPTDWPRHISCEPWQSMPMEISYKPQKQLDFAIRRAVSNEIRQQSAQLFIAMEQAYRQLEQCPSSQNSQTSQLLEILKAGPIHVNDAIGLFIPYTTSPEQSLEQAFSQIKTWSTKDRSRRITIDFERKETSEPPTISPWLLDSMADFRAQDQITIRAFDQHDELVRTITWPDRHTITSKDDLRRFQRTFYVSAKDYDQFQIWAGNSLYLPTHTQTSNIAKTRQTIIDQLSREYGLNQRAQKKLMAGKRLGYIPKNLTPDQRASFQRRTSYLRALHEEMTFLNARLKLTKTQSQDLASNLLHRKISLKEHLKVPIEQITTIFDNHHHTAHANQTTSVDHLVGSTLWQNWEKLWTNGSIHQQTNQRIRARERLLQQQASTENKSEMALIETEIATLVGLDSAQIAAAGGITNLLTTHGDQIDRIGSHYSHAAGAFAVYQLESLRLHASFTQHHLELVCAQAPLLCSELQSSALATENGALTRRIRAFLLTTLAAEAVARVSSRKTSMPISCPIVALKPLGRSAMNSFARLSHLVGFTRAINRLAALKPQEAVFGSF